MKGKEGCAPVGDVLQPSLGWDVEVVMGGNSPRSQSGDPGDTNVCTVHNAEYKCTVQTQTVQTVPYGVKSRK